MHLIRSSLLASVLLACFGAAHARAQSIPSPYVDLVHTNALTLRAGYLFTDATVSLTDSTSAEFGPQSAPTVGLRYHRRLSNAATLEVGTMFVPSERKVYGARVGADSTRLTPERTGEVADMPLLLADVGGRLNLTGARTYRGIAPYIAAAGGIVTWLSGSTAAEKAAPANERFDFGPGFALGLRVGTDWYPSQRFSVNVEVGDQLWKLRVPTGFRNRTTAVSEWTNNLGIRAGAAVHF